MPTTAKMKMMIVSTNVRLPNAPRVRKIIEMSCEVWYKIILREYEYNSVLVHKNTVVKLHTSAYEY